MKTHRLIAFASSLALLAGCFSVDTATCTSTGDEHVVVSNYGWTLFNCIPLCCGNATKREDRFGPWAFFRNDVTMEKLQNRFMDYAKARGRELECLTYHKYETVLFNIPFTQIPVPLPYIVCFRELQLSGVVK
ncbi:MAG: hypothetical protein K6G91_13325 [Kiritimatiellae bacterium]|nr:hypothetical protein [Kiritimatiellia bacterium]